MNPIAKVQDAWRTAAERIGFEFFYPYSIGDSSERVEYHGFVPGFGSPKGTLFIASLTFEEDVGVARQFATGHGYFFSIINAAGYSSYDRALFLETLKDWGWHSSDMTPPHGFARPIKSEKRKAPNQSARPNAHRPSSSAHADRA